MGVFDQPTSFALQFSCESSWAKYPLWIFPSKHTLAGLNLIIAWVKGPFNWSLRRPTRKIGRWCCELLKARFSIHSCYLTMCTSLGDGKKWVSDSTTIRWHLKIMACNWLKFRSTRRENIPSFALLESAQEVKVNQNEQKCESRNKNDDKSAYISILKRSLHKT